VRDRPGVTSAVIGARDPAQLLGSLAADEVVLPDSIRAALDDVSSGLDEETGGAVLEDGPDDNGAPAG
jgi:aryl-alcohol dehydrogenase-like predicted oxidoreductase